MNENFFLHEFIFFRNEIRVFVLLRNCLGALTIDILIRNVLPSEQQKNYDLIQNANIKIVCVNAITLSFFNTESNDRQIYFVNDTIFIY